MRKKFIGKTDAVSMINNKVYEVISIEQGWYRIVCEEGEDYLFPPELFVEEDEEGYVDMTVSDYMFQIIADIEPNL